MDVAFVPVSDQDTEMLLGWLATPEVRKWWGDPEAELKLIKNSKGSGTGDADCYIVKIDNTPTGFIQSWDPDKLDEKWLLEEPWLRDVQSGALGIDIFIGEPNMIGKGVGSRIISEFCKKLFSDGANRLLIDPDAKNERAIRAYAKVGFTTYDEYWNTNGGTILMDLTPDKLEATND